MWLNGFILITVLTAAKSAEAELNVEAAFQGHCGHTSPCEQLCYEIHDGMYECDCIEGYELNKNGYSCQVINSTIPAENPTKSEEDVLYQKGASFSAKLARGVNTSNPMLTSLEENYDSVDEFVTDIDDIQNLQKSNSYIDSNSRDFYISSDSISFNDDHLDLNLVPEYNQVNFNSKNYTNQNGALANSVTSDPNRRAPLTTHLSKSASPLENTNSQGSESSNNLIENDYYSKIDMSVYDDVNNNKLNLRPIDELTYQQEYNRLQAKSSSSTSTLMPTDPVNTFTINSLEESTSTMALYQGHIDTSSTSPLRETKDNSTSNTKSGQESCSLNCGIDGMCDIGEDNIPQCLCSFGKSGDGCIEDTKVHVPRFTKRSWLAFPALRGAYKHVQIRVEIRPESSDGIILLTGERDDLTGDFMALLIYRGYIEFWFDCGSGVGSVRSQETVNLHKWNSITIYRHRWDAWLLLNHGSRVQGRSKGLFSRITFREPVFLGGTGNITGLAKRLPVDAGLHGCIRRFVANEHEYTFSEHPLGDVSKGFGIVDCQLENCHQSTSENKCSSPENSKVYNCPETMGEPCGTNSDIQVPFFNGSTFLRYTPLGDSALIWLELQLIIKPMERDGIILYTGHENRGDFISLSLKGGYVEFSFDLGSGPASVRSEYSITTGRWHTIKVSRTARLAVLKVDKLPEVMTISSNGFWHLSLQHDMYLGGVSPLEDVPNTISDRHFFIGCIQKVEINSRSISILGEAIGNIDVENCPHACNNRPCGPLAECIPILNSYQCRCQNLHSNCNNSLDSNMNNLDANNNESASVNDIEVITEVPKNTKSTQHNNKPPVHNKLHAESLLKRLHKDNHPWHNGHKRNRKTSEHTRTFRPIANKVKRNKHLTSKLLSQEPKLKDTIDANFYNNYEPHNQDFNFYKNDDLLSLPDADLLSDKTYSHWPVNDDPDTHIYHDLNESPILKKPSHETPLHDNDNTPYRFHFNGKYPRTRYRKKIHETTPRGHHKTHKQDVEVNEGEPALNIVRKGAKRDHSHTLKFPKNQFDEVESIHKPLSAHMQSVDKDAVTVEDISALEKDYHSEEFFQDMKRIMKNSQSDLLASSSERLEVMDEKAYDEIESQEPVIRKSLGACFTGIDSYFHYNDAETMSQIISYKTDLNLRIKTFSKNGIILWTGRQSALDTDDYLSLGIENGFLHLRYNLGSGEANVQYNTSKISDGLWHRVRAIRNAQEGYLEVDGRKTAKQRSPGKLKQLNTDTGLYVGSMGHVSYYTRRRYSIGIMGCISEIILDGELQLNFDPATLGTAHNVETGVL